MLLRQFLPLLPWGCPGTGTSENRDKGERDEIPVLTDRSSSSPPPGRNRELPLELSPFVIPWLRDVGGKHMVSSAFCSLLFAFRRPEIPAAWILSVQYLKPWDNRQRSPVENRQERGQTIEPWGTPTLPLARWRRLGKEGKKQNFVVCWLPSKERDSKNRESWENSKAADRATQIFIRE